MEAFTTVQGSMVPLMAANIDTDQIIPTEFLKRVERAGFGQYLFFEWATDADGKPDPEFVLNRPERRDAVVLVTGPNFGSGSSREHAPWALQDWGFRAIIAPSFADIFKANCHKIGLLPVELPAAVVETLAAASEDDPRAEVRVDLESQSVAGPGVIAPFEIDPSVRRALLGGLDEIDMTLEHEEAIAAFEAQRPQHKPVFAGAETGNGDPHD